MLLKMGSSLTKLAFIASASEGQLPMFLAKRIDKIIRASKLMGEPSISDSQLT